jgi:hypothetical protein
MPEIPEGAKKPADRLKAEVENATEETVAEFKGVSLRVMPFLDWERHAMQHLNNFNYDGWAEGALHPEDFKKFLKIKSTNREIMQFIGKASANAGADLGEFGASLDS